MIRRLLHWLPACFLLIVLGSGGCLGATPPYVWKNVAIGGGGYVTDVYCHPKQKDLVYLRTDVGGFYRWDAPGSRWVPLTDRFTRDQSNYYGGEALALDPQDPKLVYIAAGKYSADGAAPGTIFKSRDQGRHWTKLPIDLRMGGNEDHRWGGPRLAVSPAHPKVLLFGSRRDGLWRSADAGASWAKVAAFPGTPKDGLGITALVFGTQTAGVVYAAAFGDGVYRSEDDGRTWRKTPDSPAEVERLAAAPDGALYATHAHGVGKYAQGRWADVTPPGVGKAFGGLSVNPRDTQDLLAAAQADRLRLFRSHNGGTVWAEVKTETRSSVPWHSSGMKQIQYVAGLTFDPCVPGRVWLSDWYAAYRTDDLGAAPVVLTSHERGHEELVVFALACPPGGPTLLSGTADVDGFVHDVLDTFPAHGLGDYYGGRGPTYGYTEGLAWCASQPAFVARAGVIPWGNQGGVALSSDGGRTWRAAAGWDPKILAARIAVSASDPQAMVALRVGSGPALTTRDGGASWQEVHGLPDSLIPGVWNWQTPLTADGASPKVFYVYAGGTVYKSTDGGASFAVSAAGLPGGASALISEPGRAGVLWLAAGDGGLLRSTDSGGTFHALPAVRQASLLAVGKPAPGASLPTLYLCGALPDGRKGLFRSVTDGSSWDDITDPAVPVGDEPNSMAASEDTFGLVFIGTNGRGIYYGAPAGAPKAAAAPSLVPVPPGEAVPLPYSVSPADPRLRYEGRFDRREAAGPRGAWPASAVHLRVFGTALNVRLSDSDNDSYEVVVDGKRSSVLTARGGTHLYRVFDAPAGGSHTVALVKRTEAFCGTTQFLGFQVAKGGRLLLPPPAPAHRLEVIGDSISCGYGNEAKDQHEKFTAATENAFLSYGAVAARAMGADYTCVAWSGRTLWRNDAPKNTMGEVYDFALPLDPGSRWDFSSWIPDAVVINLSTNDFNGGAPDRKRWTDAYKAFLARVRGHYPRAALYCATSPMLWGDSAVTARAYLTQVVADENAAGEKNVRLLVFETQDEKDGFGADWHPSLKTHQLMAAKLAATLNADLGWIPAAKREKSVVKREKTGE